MTAKGRIKAVIWIICLEDVAAFSGSSYFMVVSMKSYCLVKCFVFISFDEIFDKKYLQKKVRLLLGLIFAKLGGTLRNNFSLYISIALE